MPARILAFTQRPTLRIHASFVRPPISVRTHDWCATLNGYEPGEVMGWGETEDAAVDDLLSILGGSDDDELAGMAASMAFDRAQIKTPTTGA